MVADQSHHLPERERLAMSKALAIDEYEHRALEWMRCLPFNTAAFILLGAVEIPPPRPIAILDVVPCMHAGRADPGPEAPH